MKEKSLNSPILRKCFTRFAGPLGGVLCVVAGISLAFAEPMMEGNSTEGKACARRAAGQQVIEQHIAALPETQRAQLLELLNQGSGEALSSISGIGGTRSAAIQAARPFASLSDLLRVPGIGTNTLMKVLKHDPSAKASGSMEAGS